MNQLTSRVLGVAIAGVLLGSLASCSAEPRKLDEQPPGAQATASPRHRTSLDADWAFHRGDIEPSAQVVAADFDDKSWQRVDVPHDYILDGKYDPKAERNHGYLPLEVGWYRKHFVVPEPDKGKTLSLDFDGVFRDAEVWLNGQRLGRHESGYTPFSFDVTKVARVGGDNVIAVRVDPRQTEGWWYEGGGIYRHVRLTALDPVHVAQWGTFVVSTVPGGDQGKTDEANLAIQTTIENSGGAAATTGCTVVTDVIDPDGKTIKTIKTDAKTPPANAQQTVAQQATIDHPKLWGVKSPQLYSLRTTILLDGRPVDSTTTTFGIRTIRFDKDKGFFLNGEHVEIQGVACHQDFAGVGIAVPDSLEPWRVAQLKKLGANGWRTAHNPPNEEVLDACDRLGMLVMDENRHLGDSYKAKTPAGTPSTDLSDLATMIRRDRNHPSIIMWSMCNEEGLQGKAEGAAIVKAMMKEVRRYDTSRPITSAMNAGWLNPSSIADAEDMIGVNYGYKSLDKIHQRHPDKMMFGSEDSNEKTTRGEYASDKATGMVTAYNLSEKTWGDMINHPYMAGSYTWTGFDYKGEPNPFGWPDVSNNTGLLDSCGFPKDKAYYFKSCWTTEPMVHLLPMTWNWPGQEGKEIRVIAFSNAPKVELFLNGKSLGSKDVPHDTHAEWQVPYQPGSLTARAYVDGKQVATDEVQTTGPAARIELTADRTTLHAGAHDSVVAAVSIVDEQGRLVHEANQRVTFQLTGGGDGRILGVGNGNPADHDPDHADNRNAFHGHCMAVIQAGAKPGSFELTATAPGLKPASIRFEVR